MRTYADVEGARKTAACFFSPFFFRRSKTKQKHVDTSKNKDAPAKPNNASKPDLAHLVAVLVDQLRYGVVLIAVCSSAPAADRPPVLDHVAEAGAGPESPAVDERRHPEARVSYLHVGGGPDLSSIAERAVGVHRTSHRAGERRIVMEKRDRHEGHRTERYDASDVYSSSRRDVFYLREIKHTTRFALIDMAATPLGFAAMHTKLCNGVLLRRYKRWGRG